MMARNARSILTLAISDVPHDDPAVIASGPTVPDPSTLADAREICERRNIPLPETAKALLNDPANETPKAGDPSFRPRRIPHHRPSHRRPGCGGGGREARRLRGRDARPRCGGGSP